MPRNIFGWSLPPGVSTRDIDPPEAPCSVCGEFEDSCICPECPICHSFGDPLCYRKPDGHGLTASEEQRFSLACREREWEQWNREEALFWEEQYRIWKEEEKDAQTQGS